MHEKLLENRARGMYKPMTKLLCVSKLKLN